MKLKYTNSTVSIKRRTTTTGNKKQDATIQTSIPAFVDDTGTTADHEQTYLIMLNVGDVTATLNSDTDTIYDGTDTYKIANCSKRRFQYDIRAIKIL
jgi:hypothetical protein